MTKAIKKTFKWVGITFAAFFALIVILLIVDISNDDEQPEAVEAVKEVEVPKEKIEAAPAPKEEPKIDSNLYDYGMHMSDLMGEFSTIMGDFSTLMTDAGNDPNLMLDDTWSTDVALQIILMQDIIEEIRSVTPPEKAKEAHALILQSMDDYSFVSENIGTAIDTVDIDLINECSTKLIEGSTTLGEATVLIEELAKY